MKQVAVLLIMTGQLVTGLENGLARTPPMGWLAWERFRLVKVSLASLGKIQVSQGDPSQLGKDSGQTRCHQLAWERFRLDKLLVAGLGKIQVTQGVPSQLGRGLGQTRKVSLSSFGRRGSGQIRCPLQAWERLRLDKVSLASLGEVQVRQSFPGLLGRGSCLTGLPGQLGRVQD